MVKTKVEDCLILDIRDLTRECDDSPAFYSHGPFCRGKHEFAMCEWMLIEDSITVWLHLEGKPHFKFYLTRTPTRLGGERIWFVCPECEGRALKLYQPPPPGRPLFLCLHCHGLTYEKRQTRVSEEVKALERLEKLQKVMKTPNISARRRWQARADTEAILEELKPKPMPASLWKQAERLAAKQLGNRKTEELLGQPADPTAVPAEDAAPAKRPRGRPPKQKRAYHRDKPFLTSERETPTQAPCFRCREWREPVDTVRVTYSNGRPAVVGTCPVCGAKVTRVVEGT